MPPSAAATTASTTTTTSTSTSSSWSDYVDRTPDVGNIPVYESFFFHHDTYQRYHIHLVGLVSSASASGGGGAVTAAATLPGRDRLIGLLPRAKPDPYVTVSIVGTEDGDDEDATGMTDYFPIGTHRFPTLHQCPTPVWDAKCVLIGRKKDGTGGGSGGDGTKKKNRKGDSSRHTNGIEFVMWDEAGGGKDQELYRLTVNGDDLPPVTLLADSTWTRYVIPVGGTKGDDHLLLEFHLMITDGSDRIVTAEMTRAIYGSTDGNVDDDDGTATAAVEAGNLTTITDDGDSHCEVALQAVNDDGYAYSEVVLRDGDTGDAGCSGDGAKALLQCWRDVRGGRDRRRKAVLWVLGRNDCFMHPHVAAALFFAHGYDLYVLNYRMNGQCRKRGWVFDAHFNSHVPGGTFDVYVGDIRNALSEMMATTPAAATDHHKDPPGSGGGYEMVIGYAHSTGAPILLNYLMEEGDGAFDAFMFNSPFLDWGFVGGDMAEFVLEHTTALVAMGAMDNDTKVGTAETPPALADRPLTYLGQDIVLSDWSAKLWSLYYFDFENRPLYKVPMTAGFARGVTAVHDKMQSWHEQNRPITAKPFLCVTSRGDDVLKAHETLSRADWVGPGRWEVELNDNGHDVFLSSDKADTDMALDMCLAWMKNRKLLK